jgi:predicted ATP-grasp superfamily ATP-dependent carboligase
MELIAQPFIAGQPLSVAAIVSRNGIEMFPVCTQTIVGKRFEYAGGTVPASIGDADVVIELAKRAIASVPGLRGYIGVDLILRDDGSPVVVEINPRLTSSYHGYRRLATSNLATRVLQPDVETRPVAWNTAPIEFLPNGSAIGKNE